MRCDALHTRALHWALVVCVLLKASSGRPCISQCHPHLPQHGCRVLLGACTPRFANATHCQWHTRALKVTLLGLSISAAAHLAHWSGEQYPACKLRPAGPHRACSAVWRGRPALTAQPRARAGKTIMTMLTRVILGEGCKLFKVQGRALTGPGPRRQDDHDHRAAGAPRLREVRARAALGAHVPSCHLTGFWKVNMLMPGAHPVLEPDLLLLTQRGVRDALQA